MNTNPDEMEEEDTLPVEQELLCLAHALSMLKRNSSLYDADRKAVTNASALYDSRKLLL